MISEYGRVLLGQNELIANRSSMLSLVYIALHRPTQEWPQVVVMEDCRSYTRKTGEPGLTDV